MDWLRCKNCTKFTSAICVACVIHYFCDPLRFSFYVSIVASAQITAPQKNIALARKHMQQI